MALELQPVNSPSDIPTGIAVHGTTRKAWDSIREQGLSRMTRNHIHLAQGVPGSGIISGMRNSSSILIYIDIQKALDAGIKFYLSANGVVLTEGDANGFLSPHFFARVETSKREPLSGWEGAGPIQSLNQNTSAEKSAVSGVLSESGQVGLSSKVVDESTAGLEKTEELVL